MASSWGLGLGVLVLLLAVGSTNTKTPHRKYIGHSPDIEFRSSKVTVPSVFRNNANQVASKVTKALNAAALKFPRRNALKMFKKYTGGFKINKDYLVSVAFVGIWGYALAALCLIFALMICACKCCCYLCGYTLPDKETQTRSSTRRQLRLTTITFLVFFIMAGTAVFFWGTWKTGMQLKRTTSVLLNATDFIFSTSDGIVDSLNQIATVITDPTTLSDIQAATSSVGSNTGGLSNKVNKIKTKIPLAIQLAVIFLDLIASFVLLFAVIGLVATCISSPGLGTVAFLGMGFMLVGVWLLAGVDFTLSNVTNDVCQDMDTYITTPASSQIVGFLPCGTQAQADAAAANVKAAIKDIVGQMNTQLSAISGTLPSLCDPYGAGPAYANAVCGGATKQMATFDTDYAAWKCSSDDPVACAAASTPLTLSNFAAFSQAAAAGALVQATVGNLGPVITCSFIQDAFTVIVNARCVRLIDGMNIIWFGFAITGACMMPLQLLWLLI